LLNAYAGNCERSWKEKANEEMLLCLMEFVKDHYDTKRKLETDHEH